jgi:small GTP-binding protein
LVILAKIILIGDGAVGKTSLRNNFLGKSFDGEYMPTLGADFAIKNIILHEADEEIKIRFQIWDLAGQPNFNQIRSLYFKYCVGALIVFDVTRQDTLYSLINWLEELSKDSDSNNISCLVLGNKIDLKEEYESYTSPDTVKKYIQKELKGKFENIGLNIEYYETSAKTGVNVEKAFYSLGQMVYEKFNEL